MTLLMMLEVKLAVYVVCYVIPVAQKTSPHSHAATFFALIASSHSSELGTENVPSAEPELFGMYPNSLTILNSVMKWGINLDYVGKDEGAPISCMCRRVYPILRTSSNSCT